MVDSVWVPLRVAPGGIANDPNSMAQVGLRVQAEPGRQNENHPETLVEQRRVVLEPQDDFDRLARHAANKVHGKRHVLGNHDLSISGKSGVLDEARLSRKAYWFNCLLAGRSRSGTLWLESCRLLER